MSTSIASKNFLCVLCMTICMVSMTIGCGGVVQSHETPSTVAPSTDASPVAASGEKMGANWPLFRGDALATGVAKSSLAKNPELLWKHEVEGGAFEGSAVIVEGVAYVGDLDGRLYAFELRTGKPKWITNFSQKAWTFEGGKATAKEDDREISGFMAAPSVQDGLLYIGDIFGRFFCVDTKAGEIQWGFEAQAEIDAAANFYKGQILFGSQDATLYCLDAKTGKEIWKHQIEDQIRCSPTIVGDRTFVAGCDSRLHIIDLEKGQAVNGVDIDSPTMVTPAVLGDNVYFGTEGGTLYCINWKEAKTAWTYRDAERSQSMRSSPAVTKEIAVFGGRSKRVYAVDPNSGKELWTFATKGGVDSSPVIVGDRAFVGSADGRLYALALSDGAKVWEYEAGGGFVSSPAVADGCLVIANDRGVVYCFGAKE